MKKIGKLSINPEKVIKNEELVNLKGGYTGGGNVIIRCSDGANPPYANPQPCAWYPNAEALVNEAIRKCKNGNATFSSC